MITILPSKVKLLHFPRSHLQHVTHAIVKACFFEDTKDPHYFFSFTENAYEISIVGSKEIIDNEFVPILQMSQCHDMRTSSGVYRVLQVDDEGGEVTTRISGPLAQGKFSIFYMSTYQTDFVLIKERRLKQAVQLLQQHEFEFDMDSIDQYLGGSPPPPPPFSSSQDSTIETEGTSALREDFEKSVLSDELQCVGLNPHYRSEWAMTVLKILSYPELISPPPEKRFFSYTASSEDVSLIANQHIIDLFEQDAIFQDEEYHQTYRVIQVNLAGSNLERCGIVWSISHPLITEAHINLLYLSTFKSANVLVSSDDLGKAEEVLADDLENIKGMLAEVVLEPTV